MKKLFFALPLLLAACHSERVAFHFQPVAPAENALPKRAAKNAPAEAAPRAALATAAIATAALLAAAAPAERAAPAGRRHSVPARPAATAELPTLAAAPVDPAATPRPLPRALLKRLVRQHATAGPARTTENGLGGIGLFFIAVVLGLLAGLGALVSLLPGVSFFGGVGLAAAGLLVLFILYSLVSGGGKKKKAPAK